MPFKCFLAKGIQRLLEGDLFLWQAKVAGSCKQRKLLLKTCH